MTMHTEITPDLSSVAATPRGRIATLMADGRERTVNDIVAATGLGESTVRTHVEWLTGRNLLIVDAAQGVRLYRRGEG